MVKRYVVIDTDDLNPADMDLELGPVYEESETVSSDDAYISDTEADAMMVSRPQSASWTAATADQKNEALKEATRRIDCMPIRGRKYDISITAGIPDQALAFPRVIGDETFDWNNSSHLAIVPTAVKWACLEEALAILATGTGGIKDLQDQGVDQFSIGGKLSYTFAKGHSKNILQSLPARRHLQRYLGAVTR